MKKQTAIGSRQSVGLPGFLLASGKWSNDTKKGGLFCVFGLVVENDFWEFVIAFAIDQIAAVGAVDFFVAAVLFVKVGNAFLFALTFDVVKAYRIEQTALVCRARFAASYDPIDLLQEWR